MVDDTNDLSTDDGDEPMFGVRAWEPLCRAMIVEQIEARDVTNPAVLEALQAIPRHAFVAQGRRHRAYEDCALPIGEGQTISQPYIVALMTSLIDPKPEMRVLEIGTGSGYQAAVLSKCVGVVDTIENHPRLARAAVARFRTLGLENIRARTGDGYNGWPENAPYDAVLLTAAPERVPPPLLDQLKVGGRLVAPVGSSRKGQELVVVTRTSNGFETATIAPVMFVPMTGRAEGKRGT